MLTIALGKILQIQTFWQIHYVQICAEIVVYHTREARTPKSNSIPEFCPTRRPEVQSVNFELVHRWSDIAEWIGKTVVGRKVSSTLEHRRIHQHNWTDEQQHIELFYCFTASVCCLLVVSVRCRRAWWKQDGFWRHSVLLALRSAALEFWKDMQNARVDLASWFLELGLWWLPVFAK